MLTPEDGEVMGWVGSIHRFFIAPVPEIRHRSTARMPIRRRRLPHANSQSQSPLITMSMRISMGMSVSQIRPLQSFDAERSIYFLNGTTANRKSPSRP
jgi:hypothetical protein